MIDSLYNPDSMSKHEIQHLFVARRPLLEEILRLISDQEKGPGIQHVLMIAPRGMGKTTMLLMLQYSVQDSNELTKEWQVVRFPEENYGITDLADLWIRIAREIASTTRDSVLNERIDRIEMSVLESEALRESVWVEIKQWRIKNSKRILLLVDNIDMILDQIGDQTEHARLRNILMNEDVFMLLGCAPSYFSEIADYEQPLYNFFRIFNLNELKFQDIEELLRKRANLDDFKNINELLRTNKSGIRALEKFTGGNPRLVLMLYRIITRSDMIEIRDGLERLLDAVTPYYKDKTEKLPAQQRKILDQIVRISLETGEGANPGIIASRTRLSPNQVSAQLNRLTQNGYIKQLKLKGKSTYYTMTEPLYVIWSQMRFGRDAREKRRWLVNILRSLFELQDIQKEIKKLTTRIRKYKTGGRDSKARGTLEFLVCLIETDSSLVEENFKLTVESYLELGDLDSLKAEIPKGKLADLPKTTLKRVFRENQITEFDYEKALCSLLFKEIRKNITAVDNSETLPQGMAKIRRATKGIDELATLKAATHLSRPVHLLRSLVYAEEAEIHIHFDQPNTAAAAAASSLDELNAVHDPDFHRMFKSHFVRCHVLRAHALVNLGRLDTEVFGDVRTAADLMYSMYKDEGPNVQLSPKDLHLSFMLALFGDLFEKEVDAASMRLRNYFDLLTHVRMLETDKSLFGSFIHLAFLDSIGSMQEVIVEARLTHELGPLLSLLEYKKSKDVQVLEKLSPEVRLVVEEGIKVLGVFDFEILNSEDISGMSISVKDGIQPSIITRVEE